MGVMRSQSRLPWILIFGAIVAVAIVLGAVWAVAPEDARGLLMLAGGTITVAVYLALYAIQRRRHWGS
jgi:quinol-cytochrome oxidoreductase complex cytochrome b subunit